eukprot:TRINITY_DN523_c0_g1_i1.p1 TRINITY_DN523_c0_g1~~TRINITY_DN523_c0_g1_i1.p1  ORF type:complete len:263 (+),score=31.72 TRINITY_DN523_c0_g1_i1:3-791(+)
MVQQQQQQLDRLLAAVTEKSAEVRRTHPGGFFPELDVVSEVLLLTLGWALLFIVLRYFIFSKLSYDFNNRLVSVIHCLVVFPLALQTLNWSDPLGNVGGSSTEKEGRILEVSFAYFVYDLIGCTLDASTRDISMSIHHIVSMLGMGWGLFSHTDGNELVVCLALVEISNPCMHTREFIKEFGLTGTAVEMANNLLFAATFTVARVVFGPILTWKTVASDKPPLPIKIGAGALQVVSTYWWYLVARMVYYKVVKGRGRKAKKT